MVVFVALCGSINPARPAQAMCWVTAVRAAIFRNPEPGPSLRDLFAHIAAGVGERSLRHENVSVV